jgi:hypothetical protein
MFRFRIFIGAFIGFRFRRSRARLHFRQHRRGSLHGSPKLFPLLPGDRRRKRVERLDPA